MAEHRTDILIAGGGGAGLTLALALRRSVPDLAVTVVDAGVPGGGRSDGRASAIAAAARRMLEQLGVWDELAGVAQPIVDMIVTDSRTGDAVRPLFLTFDGAVASGEPFAQMVPNNALTAALAGAAEAAGVRFITGNAVLSFADQGEAMRVTLKDGTATARLLVAADGVRSRLRDLAGIRTLKHSYGQVGLVTTVTHERPHGGRAEEHFLPAGPFAILPLRGPDGAQDRSSLVWTERAETAAALMEADDATFDAELARRFGRHLGRLHAIGGRHSYPLSLTLARDFVRPRFALLGDAAHGIHPLAGQGLNLGLRDAAALAETIVEAARLGLDIGSLPVLQRYERWRRFDTLEMSVVTDGLNRLFSNDNPLLRAVRDVGLGLVDRLPGLKRRFIREAAGLAGDTPRLLRGETL